MRLILSLGIYTSYDMPFSDNSSSLLYISRPHKYFDNKHVQHATQLLLSGDSCRLCLQLHTPWLLHHKIDDGHQVPILDGDVRIQLGVSLKVD